MITNKTIGFLKKIEANNQREWFAANRALYEIAHEEMIVFAEQVFQKMEKVDQLIPMTGKQSLYRIYRDVRFSKNKTPYKNSWSGRLKRDTDWLRGGYFYHIEPGNRSLVACGFWNPNAKDLKLIRDNIVNDDQELRKILKAKKFKDTFGALQGTTLKTAPRGYDKEHPAVDLLRHKQFVVTRHFTDREVKSEEFLNEVVKTFKNVRPFFDYMSDILTHDLNGLPLY